MTLVVLETVGLVLAGLLAGEELIVRYGVQPALNHLPDRAHLLARQALVRRLRVVVPILLVPTVLVAVAVLAFGGAGAGAGFRWAGVIAFVAFVLFSALGTVPINIAVNGWSVEDPPADWPAIVARWGRIDVFRSSAAITGFACFAVALAVQLP